MRTSPAALLVLLAACSSPGFSTTGEVPLSPDASAPPFLACHVLSVDDAGLSSGAANYTCGAPGVTDVQWAWTGDGYAGSCAVPFAGCAYGSPCVVATATSYVQGACL